MATLIEKKRTWRAAALILLVIAILGPWAYERLHVPAQYDCAGPSVRLEGDFCGLPFSLLKGLAMLFVSLLGILSGDIAISRDPLILTLALMPLVLIMPMFTNLYLLWRNQQVRWQVFNVTAWGLAAITAGVFLSLSGLRLAAPPWGVLLYIVVALSVLALELLSPIMSRRAIQS
jgi:hypothetical protein